MAAIDKIYANIEEATEFIKWVEDEGDKAFKEFCCDDKISLKNFMYVKCIEDLKEISKERQKSFPISNFPSIVDKWLLKMSPNLPLFAEKELCFQYGIKTKEELVDFIKSPIIEYDKRNVGKHIKIVKRTGCLEHCNYIISPIMSQDNWYKRHKWIKEHYSNDNDGYAHYDEYYESLSPDELELNEDNFWYVEETDDWENSRFPKLKNLMFGCSSHQHFRKKMSLKSIIRQILKKYRFPIGTILKIEEFRYHGEIYVEVTK